jgi:excisionase family DNA binding protein
LTIIPSPTEGDNSPEGIIPAWLTYPQAVTYTNLSRVTLWRSIEAGDIQAAKVGRAVRISQRSLDEFMQSRCG